MSVNNPTYLTSTATLKTTPYYEDFEKLRGFLNLDMIRTLLSQQVAHHQYSGEKLIAVMEKICLGLDLKKNEIGILQNIKILPQAEGDFEVEAVLKLIPTITEKEGCTCKVSLDFNKEIQFFEGKKIQNLQFEVIFENKKVKALKESLSFYTNRKDSQKNLQVLPIDFFTLKSVQSLALKSIALALRDGKTSLFALLGTGTGKTLIQVALGIILGKGMVYITLDETLAKETQEELRRHHGKHQTHASILLASDLTPALLAKAIEEIKKGNNVHVIMNPKDCVNLYLSGYLIKDCNILIDEVQFFDLLAKTDKEMKDLVNILTHYRKSNFVVAMSGTPTALVLNLLEQVCGYVVGQDMGKGVTRKVNSEILTFKPENVNNEEQLVIQSLQGYLEKVDYLSAADKGYMSLTEALSKTANAQGSMKESLLAALKLALANNELVFAREQAMVSAQKENFRNVFNLTYEALLAGHLPVFAAKLSENLSIKRQEERRHAAEELLKEYFNAHPQQLGDATLLEELLREIDQVDNDKTDIVAIINSGRQQRIADLVSATACSCLTGIVPFSSFIREIESRTITKDRFPVLAVLAVDEEASFVNLSGDADLQKLFDGLNLSQFATKPEYKRILLNLYHFASNREFKLLPLEHRKFFIEKTIQSIFKLLNALENNINSPLLEDPFIKIEDIDLSIFSSSAESIALSDPQIKADEVKAGLNYGTIMMLCSDDRFATGISIPALKGLIYVIQEKSDLKSPTNEAQFYGRVVRGPGRKGSIVLLVNEALLQYLLDPNAMFSDSPDFVMKVIKHIDELRQKAGLIDASQKDPKAHALEDFMMRLFKARKANQTLASEQHQNEAGHCKILGQILQETSAYYLKIKHAEVPKIVREKIEKYRKARKEKNEQDENRKPKVEPANHCDRNKIFKIPERVQNGLKAAAKRGKEALEKSKKKIGM